MYTAAIEKIVYWLEKAVAVAENDKQKKTLELLVEYYKTGDLKKWDLELKHKSKSFNSIRVLPRLL